MGGKPKAGIAWIVAASLAACASTPPSPQAACPAAGGGLADLTNAEYAFSHAAEKSVREAFLGVLAEDSLVLQPEPHPGRAVWEATPEDANRLSWYPAIADVAASGDLGFTTGPWTFTIAANGKQVHGSYVTVWKRGPSCEWRVAFDGGVSHAPAASAPAPLHPDSKPAAARVRYDTAADAAFAPSMRAFHEAARTQGLAVALLPIASTGFRAYADKQAPLDGAAAAAEYFGANPPTGTWQELLHLVAADGRLAYTVGELMDAAAARTAAFAEVWRYDEAGRRWRVRLLMLNAYPHPMPKS